MKIKKIFAAILATTLISSTFVAYAHDIDTRTPVITYNVGEKIATEAELTEKLSTITYNADYDYYPLSISVTDLGRLHLTSTSNYLVITNITFTFMTTDFALTDADGFEMYTDGVTPSVGGTWSIAQDGLKPDMLNVFWQPDPSTVNALKSQNIYPGAAKANIENASLNFEVIVALPTGKTLTLNKSDLGSLINYYDKESGSIVGVKKATITNDSLVFGKTTPTVTPWEVTITEEPAQAHGYIWKVDTTKGDGDLTKFDVTFTDAEETLERSILSATKDAYNWNAPTSFYVGLYTTRTGVTADWKAASTKDGKVIEATIK